VIINSHCHLDFLNAKDDGCIVPSIGKQNWGKASNYQNFALGIHPWQVENHNLKDLEVLEQKIQELLPIGLVKLAWTFALKQIKTPKLSFLKNNLT
jgi:Tat protein secretion system quality control protein TatD with DNase activity